MSSKELTNKNVGQKASSLIPKLRFPEFQNTREWGTRELGEVASLITERVGNRTHTPMSITSGVGLVSQLEKFGRVVAGNQYRNYLCLQEGDFAYNKSATNEYPQGFIARYLGSEPAAVPNSIFCCFRPNVALIDGDYLNQLFIYNLHGRWLSKFMTVGARAHGSLNIDDEDILAIPVPMPSDDLPKSEQKKIAECLSSADKLIAAEGRKLDVLKAYKKGLMQQLFTAAHETVPRLRFEQFIADGEWSERTIGDISSVTTGNKDTQDKVDDGLYPFFVRSQTPERINTFSYDGESILTSGDGVGVGKNFHYIVGKFDFHQRVYCIFNFHKMVHGKFVFHYFSEHFYRRAMHMNAKNSVDSVRMAMIAEMPIKIPALEEQRAVAECISSLEYQVEKQSRKINLLTEHKKGLMQQLFPVVDEIPV